MVGLMWGLDEYVPHSGTHLAPFRAAIGVRLSLTAIPLRHSLMPTLQLRKPLTES